MKELLESFRAHLTEAPKHPNDMTDEELDAAAILLKLEVRMRGLQGRIKRGTASKGDEYNLKLFRQAYDVIEQLRSKTEQTGDFEGDYEEPHYEKF